MTNPLGFAYSWTFIDSYLTCPLQFYHKYVLKDIPWVDTPAIVWGREVHKALEDNTVKGKPLEGNYAFLQPLKTKIDAIPGDHYGELKLAVNAKLEPVDYWDKTAWFRIISDHTIVDVPIAFSLDYKTGKPKTTFSRQLDLAAAVTFHNFPDVRSIGSAYVWTARLPNNVVAPPVKKIYSENDIQPIWDGFKENIKDIEWSFQHNAFPAKPSGLCKKWCDVLSCIHNGRRNG